MQKPKPKSNGISLDSESRIIEQSEGYEFVVRNPKWVKSKSTFQVKIECIICKIKDFFRSI